MGLLVSTLILAGAVAVTGSVLALRLFYVWLLILLAGWLWITLSIRGLKFEMSPLPERAKAGTALLQEVSVSAADKLPRFGLTLQAWTNAFIGPAANIDLPSGRTARWQANYPLPRRGRYALGRIMVTASEPFGLLSRKTIAGNASTVIVHPAAVPMPPFSLLGLAGSGLSTRMPEALSASASSIREYTTGDSLRHVHWKSTAHTGKYMVKTFDADRSRHRAKNYWIILDMAAAVHSGEAAESTAEYAVTLAASLAKKYLDGGYRLGLVTAAPESLVLPASSGQKHLTDILDRLAVIEPNSSIPIGVLIARHQGLFGSDATVVVITPSTFSAMTEGYHQLTSRGATAAFFLIDGTGFGGVSPAGVGRSLIQLGAPVYLLRRAETFPQSLQQAARGTGWHGDSRS
ncbi:DUF58 domain-containing protein [Dehalogenimonas sp. 4OHTPN]|uniref:DUF58 domain-containing protein n=1 Tax=Dehalogenimonas sp. 4OHTPN TaxID=3166643 RepID=A0AAU8GA26_9CHLR